MYCRTCMKSRLFLTDYQNYQQKNHRAPLWWTHRPFLCLDFGLLMTRKRTVCQTMRSEMFICNCNSGDNTGSRESNRAGIPFIVVYQHERGMRAFKLPMGGPMEKIEIDRLSKFNGRKKLKGQVCTIGGSDFVID